MSSTAPPPGSPRPGVPASRAWAGRLPTLTRRATGLALLGVATGCALDERSPSASTGPTPTTPASSAGEADPDTLAVADVSDRTAALLALVTATGRAHRELRALTRPLAALHRAHAAVLTTPAGAGTAAATPTPSVDVPGRPAAARAVLLRAERDYRGILVDHARLAESGPLARLLAAMNAGLAQLLDRPGTTR